MSRMLFDEMEPRSCPDCGASGYARGHAGCGWPKRGTFARTTDPETSKLSGAQMRSNPRRLSELQQKALALLVERPGSSAADIAEADAKLSERWRVSGADRLAIRGSRTYGRRLSELERAKAAHRAGLKLDPLTNRWVSRWWPFAAIESMEPECERCHASRREPSIVEDAEATTDGRPALAVLHRFEAGMLGPRIAYRTLCSVCLRLAGSEVADGQEG